MNELLKKIPSFIKRDFLRKAIAVFFAVIVFFKVSSQIGIEDTIDNVKVNFILPPNLVILGDENINLRIAVKASDQKTLMSLSPSDFKISITIPEHKGTSVNKEMSFNVSRDARIIKPRTVEIVSIRPDFINIQLDRKTNKEVPVKVRFSGATPEEYTCGDVELSPTKITLWGPSAVLEKINEVFTEPIALDAKTVESFECETKIVVPQKLEATPDKVRVQVEVYKKIDVRKFFSVPLDVLSSSGSSFKVTKIIPTNVDVTVQGLKSAIERLSEKDVKPFIDLSRISSPGVYEMFPMCFLGIPNAKPIDFFPEKIFVEVGN